jgi:hypothetical protein
VRTIRVASVVAGHGEVASVPILLRRIGSELLDDVWLEPLRPIRKPQQRLSSNKDDTLTKALKLAHLKLTLGQPSNSEILILVLIDAEEELACVVGPRLVEVANASGIDCRIICIVANVEFETWFVASSESLSDYLKLDINIPDNPEADGCGKRWISDRFRANHYSESVDQPRLTSKMDLTKCDARSPSFKKLLRELSAV